MAIKTRQIRHELYKPVLYTIENYPCGPPYALQPGIPLRERGYYGNSLVAFGSQYTESEGHPWRSRRSNGGLQDIGGNFFTQKKYLHVPIRRNNIAIRQTIVPGTYCRTLTYRGVVFIPKVVFADSWFPPAMCSSKTELAALGATAVARCKPTNSVADLTTFLGETMKDGVAKLPLLNLWKERTDLARKSGDEFLNVEFGWLPMISDITKFADGVVHAGNVVSQYERDAGKVVRRQYSFPPRRETLSNVEVNPGSGLNTNAFDSDYVNFGAWNDGTCYRTREISQDRWFSGAFTYYLPTGYDSRSAMDRFGTLADRLGLELTPANVWEWAPWSWAADWVSNTGDVLSNISDFANDGLFMRYGYMMEHTIVKDTYTRKNQNLLSAIATGQSSVSPVSFVTETKQRVGANPFGFGLTWEGLSSTQKAILAALGLSKTKL